MEEFKLIHLNTLPIGTEKFEKVKQDYVLNLLIESRKIKHKAMKFFFKKKIIYHGQASNNALGRDNLLLTWPVDTILIIKSTSLILVSFCLGFGNII